MNEHSPLGRFIGTGPKFPALAACALAQLILVGCAAQGDDAAATPPADVGEAMKQYLIAEAKMPGYTVSFYELEPGSVLEFEKGELASRRIEPKNLDPVQRYEYLSGEKAPEALVSAIRLAGGAGHEDEPVPSQSIVEDGTDVSQQAHASLDKEIGYGDEQWFRDTYCQHTDRFWGTDGTIRWTRASNWRDGVAPFWRTGLTA